MDSLSRSRSLIYSVLFLALGATFALSEAHGARRTATPTATATPTQAPPTEGSRCCFCVHPDPGSRSSQEFASLCNSCLATSFQRCDVSAAIPSSQFTAEGIQHYNCRTPINVINIQHGPEAQYIVDQVRVCRSAFPSCSVNIDDRSCLTFSDPARVDRYLQEIRGQLTGGAQVNICGSRSITTMVGCKLYRQSTTLVISPSAIHESLGSCQPVGKVCSVGQGESGHYQCIEPNSDLEWTQKCCVVDGPERSDGSLGVWGPIGGGCALPHCDSKSCPMISKCERGALIAQVCMPLKDTNGDRSACVSIETKCSDFGKSCVYQGNEVSGCGVPCSPATCPAVRSCSGQVYTSQGCTRPESPEQGEPMCSTFTLDCATLNKTCVANGPAPHCVPPVTPTATVVPPTPKG